MDTAVISMLIQAALEIFQRHQSAGHVLTAAEVQAELKAELAAGNSQIARWFTEKGLTPPL